VQGGFALAIAPTGCPMNRKQMFVWCRACAGALGWDVGEWDMGETAAGTRTCQAAARPATGRRRMGGPVAAGKSMR
jgi:hypothetical protein